MEYNRRNTSTPALSPASAARTAFSAATPAAPPAAPAFLAEAATSPAPAATSLRPTPAASSATPPPPATPSRPATAAFPPSPPRLAPGFVQLESDRVTRRPVCGREVGGSGGHSEQEPTPVTLGEDAVLGPTLEGCQRASFHLVTDVVFCLQVVDDFLRREPLPGPEAPDGLHHQLGCSHRLLPEHIGFPLASITRNLAPYNNFDFVFTSKYLN